MKKKEEWLYSRAKTVTIPQLKEYYERTQGLKYTGKRLDNPKLYSIQNQLIASVNQTAITKPQDNPTHDQKKPVHITQCEHCSEDLGIKSEHSSHHIVYKCPKRNVERTKFFLKYKKLYPDENLEDFCNIIRLNLTPSLIQMYKIPYK